MKRALKIELWKATHNFYFFIAIAFAALIMASDIIQNTYSTYMLKKASMEMGIVDNGVGYKLLNRWIAVNGFTLGARYYILAWPILAALPYGWAYSLELRSGTIIQFITRENRKHYFFTKYVATFLSGAILTSFPIALDLFLLAMVCPDLPPDIFEQQVPIMSGWFLSELFYTHRWCYALAWCGTEFLLGGSVACLTFLTGHRFPMPALNILFPFALLFFTGTIMDAPLTIMGWQYEKSLLQLGLAGTYSPSPGWMRVTLSIICLLLSIFWINRRIRYLDVL